MRRPTSGEVLLAAFAIAACVPAMYYFGRYGTTYTFGDTQYRHDTLRDKLAVVIPATAAALALATVTLSLFTPHGLAQQWGRELDDARRARTWARER
ncbi:MAG: hypothetical protein JWN29_1900 [Acidimicrobiales bacterium]|nr:hypothetical protein [Acidimicrobiales bacterium]